MQAFLYDEGLARFCTVSKHLIFIIYVLVLKVFPLMLAGALRGTNSVQLQESIHALDKLFNQQDKRKLRASERRGYPP